MIGTRISQSTVRETVENRATSSLNMDCSLKGTSSDTIAPLLPCLETWLFRYMYVISRLLADPVNRMAVDVYQFNPSTESLVTSN